VEGLKRRFPSVHTAMLSFITHYSREFVTKPPRRQAKRTHGAASPPAVQVRRHRACEVERLLYDPGAKKEYRNEFWFSYRRL